MTHRTETPLRAPAAAAVDAREHASTRILPSLRAGWQRLRSAHDRLNDSVLGDVLAALCFFLAAIIAAIACLAP